MHDMRSNFNILIQCIVVRNTESNIAAPSVRLFWHEWRGFERYIPNEESHTTLEGKQ
jgi:hypothetical protein